MQPPDIEEDSPENLLRAFLAGTLRNIKRMDQFMCAWVRGLPPRASVAEYVRAFIEPVATQAMDLRVEHESFMFFRDRAFYVHYKQLLPAEFAFLEHAVLRWDEFFDESVESTHGLCLHKCLHNAVADQIFPRAEICARFIGNVLAMALDPQGALLSASRFIRAWHECHAAVVVVQERARRRGAPVSAAVIGPVLAVLACPPAKIVAWDPAARVHPAV